MLSVIEESGRASISRPHAKREISALSTAVVFSQAQRATGAKLKSTYSR